MTNVVAPRAKHSELGVVRSHSVPNTLFPPDNWDFSLLGDGKEKNAKRDQVSGEKKIAGVKVLNSH